MKTKKKLSPKQIAFDTLYAIAAGAIVGTAFHFFQNSNEFAPGGVGGLATIAAHLIQSETSWSVFMITFNLPIFILLGIFVNKKLGAMLNIYTIVQAAIPHVYNAIGAKPYCLANNADDFNVVFACIATGVISGIGFSMMLKHFGAGGGTYGIAVLIKRRKPELNVAAVSFIMDACVVVIAFFVYGNKISPVICTMINLFIANMIVDNGINGIKNGYKFEIITTHPEELSQVLMSKLHHGVTRMQVHGMYSDTDKYMLMCVINKRQIGEMMKILKAYPDTFASFEKVNEVFGNFKRRT